jgi:cytochrome c553
MKTILLGIAVAIALLGCSENKEPGATTAAATAAAGKAIADRDCKGCHGLDGRGAAPGIPTLAAQSEQYLNASLKEYAQRKRNHAALRDMLERMSDADMRNIAAYYAGLPPLANAPVKDVPLSSPFEEGKKFASPCAKCHGEDGNSKTPGIPSLAGQEPQYFVLAIQEYHESGRKTGAMKDILRGSKRMELETLALYFASQTPAQRAAPPFGNPAAGEPLTAMCGGCHGLRGVSADSATPSLAGQDARYLVDAIKAYRTTRQNPGMQRYVSGLHDKDVDDIAAYYSVQKSQPSSGAATSIQELAEKCNRCHNSEYKSAVAVPKLSGQDKDYLVMALRAYRDGRRESSTMHSMSFPYSNALIEGIASWYSAQAAK